MGQVASAFARAFGGPNGNGYNPDGSPYPPSQVDAAQLGQVIENFYPGQVDLNGETQRAEQAEAGLSQAITGETQRAEAAEVAVGRRVDVEVQARQDGDAAAARTAATQAQQIADEAAARVSGDEAASQALAAQAKAFQDALTAEAVARGQGDQAAQGAVATEAQAREDGDAAEASARSQAVSAEAQARAEALVALGGTVADETADRISADAALGKRVDGLVSGLTAEASTRSSADTDLGGRIDDLAATTGASSTALGLRIDGEARDRATAVSAEADARSSADLAEAKARVDADTAEAEARRSDVAALRSLAFVAARPGDSPQGFTCDLASGLPGLPAAAAIATTTSGSVARVPGAAVIATAALFCPEPNRLYRLRYVVRRQNETLDPAGDGVSMAVAWYGADGTLLRGTTTIVAVLALTVAMGRRQFGATISRDPPDVGTLPVPAGAVYGRAYVQTYGDTAVTDVEVIAVTDVTDQGTVSIDLDDVADRLTRVEASQAAMPAAVMSEAFYDALIFG